MAFSYASLLLVSIVAATFCDFFTNGLSTFSSLSRRNWIKEVAYTATGSTLVFSSSGSAVAVETPDQLPLALRDFTKLAPLGKAGSSSSSFDGKTLNLTLQELASRLADELTVGHTGQGGYFISGDLDESIFRDDCLFVDPTNRVTSLSQYRNALRILFDPAKSRVELVKPIQVKEEEHTIEATIRSRGFLQLPWRPYITAYESSIVYTVDENGLISEQSQTWSKAASKALRESFTPGWNRPAPQSTLSPLPNEPKDVTRLFEYVNGRRPNEYTQEERFVISDLIDQIAQQARFSNFESSSIPGKWMLVYLQPGPTGAGIDRRIPFPDFDFNDNFQVFTRDTILNVGQVLGPLLQVRVRGNLVEDSPGSLTVPKRFMAQIKGGEICWKDNSCVSLPITGEGLFDSIYLGERLRIGQNINGGGARVVQVKLE